MGTAFRSASRVRGQSLCHVRVDEPGETALTVMPRDHVLAGEALGEPGGPISRRCTPSARRCPIRPPRSTRTDPTGACSASSPEPRPADREGPADVDRERLLDVFGFESENEAVDRDARVWDTTMFEAPARLPACAMASSEASASANVETEISAFPPWRRFHRRPLSPLSLARTKLTMTVPLARRALRHRAPMPARAP